jgi:hypothetical protein
MKKKDSSHTVYMSLALLIMTPMTLMTLSTKIYQISTMFWKKVPNCRHCGAIRFEYEPPGFCCRSGNVQVHIREVSAELKRLFTSQVDNDAKYFRKHIRYFNSHFSFTTLGVTLDRWVATATGTGIYTFWVQGSLYHRLDHLVPGSKGPRHMQLYFYFSSMIKIFVFMKIDILLLYVKQFNFPMTWWERSERSFPYKLNKNIWIYINL